MIIRKYLILTIICLILSSAPLFSGQQMEYRHALETSPISPILQAADKGIWGIHYCYHLTPKDELITGLAYMNIHFDFGHTNSPALIFGYRRYLWKKWHLEYQLWPSYDKFYEKNEDKYYESFDIWNEFRFGYQFDFEVKEKATFVSVQWPFGFGLYASNKPESFKENEKDNPFFYHFPVIFVGIRF